MTSSDAWDVIVLGSGVAGLAGALAGHELGLRPIVLEKARTLGGGTINSYGLIWVGQNHLAQAAGYAIRVTRLSPICGFSAVAVSTTTECRRSLIVRRKR
jgi:NADPH-dependent 2,4-dienoyl-CoA reductase/sulfur reductase-like enzyme